VVGRYDCGGGGGGWGGGAGCTDWGGCGGLGVLTMGTDSILAATAFVNMGGRRNVVEWWPANRRNGAVRGPGTGVVDGCLLSITLLLTLREGREKSQVRALSAEEKGNTKFSCQKPSQAGAGLGAFGGMGKEKRKCWGKVQ